MRIRQLLFLSALLLFALPSAAFAASLNFGGGSSYTEGDTISVPVLLSTDESANAASAHLTYSSDVLTLVSISKSGSIISLWAQDPGYSQQSGTAQFEGVILNPGWSGTNGTLVTLTFQAKAPGAAVLTFQNGSVLANDGKGTELLASSPSKSITIGASAPAPATQKPAAAGTAPSITSSTHPSQDAWYKETTVALDWSAVPGSSWVRIGYDRKPQGLPGVVYNPAIYHKEITLQDGVWYFHVQEKGADGWGPVATYKIQIDTSLQPPQAVPEPAPTVEVASSTPVGLVAPQTPVSVPLWALLGTGLLLALLLVADIATRLRRKGARAKGWNHPEVIVHKQFSELREAVSAELLALEHAKTRRALSAEEERFADRLKKMLDKAERAIEKELS